MDRKLKERLIGLVVLLTAAVILLPMVLGGPEDDGERTLRLDRERMSEDLPVTRLDLREPDAREEVVSRPRSEPLPEDEDTESERSEPDPVDSDVDGARVVDAEGSTGHQAEAPEPEAETSPKTEVVEEAPDAIPEGSGWTAQVGSFSDQSNAQGLIELLRDEGFEAFLMRHERGGSTFYRVRVGLEPERDDAQRIAERIRERTGHEASPVPHP